MAYCIIEVRHKEFPNAGAVSSALATLGLTFEELLSAFKTYICPLSPVAGTGYGPGLAEDIKEYLEKMLPRDGLLPSRKSPSLSYSEASNDFADFALIHERSNKAVFFEIAFRHNVERDLHKFQMGAVGGTLAAAVLVLPVDPKAIDSAFATMPSYDSVVRMLEASQPDYPLVLVGLRGSHAA
jgi:hypothetical protein